MADKLYFAKRTLRITPSKEIPDGIVKPNRRVPPDVIKSMKPADLDRYLATRIIVEGDAALQPKTDKIVLSNELSAASWGFSIESTEGKSLDQLNMMVRDHVEKHGLAVVEPFDDVAEARHWLAHDIKKP